MVMTPRLLPLLYFLVGYISLPLAFAAVAFAPRSLGGFYYHARLIGVVHLVTLGWITSVILGLLYLMMPLLLREPSPGRRGDYWALASFLVGVIGMTAHFWIQEFSGMAWSGLMVAIPIVYVGGRVVPRLIQSTASPGLKLPLVLAFVNIAVAAAAGVVLGFDKIHHFLPGYVVANVLAHAHLAAIGWGCMMTIAALHAAASVDRVRDVPSRSIATTAILLEVAAIGLGVSLLLASRWSAVFAALAVCAFARFLRDVLRLHRDRPAAALPRPDVSHWHVVQGCAYLMVAAPVGFALTVLEPSDTTLRLAFVYGTAGLVGFIAQCLLGIQMRLVPLAFGTDPSRPCAVPAFVMWSVALPLLALGFFMDSAPLLSIAGTAGCVATVATGVQGAFVVWPAFAPRGWLKAQVGTWSTASPKVESADGDAVPPGTLRHVQRLIGGARERRHVFELIPGWIERDNADGCADRLHHRLTLDRRP
jgi:hypothetical protein